MRSRDKTADAGRRQANTNQLAEIGHYASCGVSFASRMLVAYCMSPYIIPHSCSACQALASSFCVPASAGAHRWGGSTILASWPGRCQIQNRRIFSPSGAGLAKPLCANGVSTVTKLHFIHSCQACQIPAALFVQTAPRMPLLICQAVLLARAQATALSERTRGEFTIRPHGCQIRTPNFSQPGATGSYIARRPSRALASVTSSVYSRSPPTGRPRARRVTLTGSGASCWWM